MFMRWWSRKHFGKLIVRKIPGRVGPRQGGARLQLCEVELIVLDDTRRLVGARRCWNSHVHVLERRLDFNKGIRQRREV